VTNNNGEIVTDSDAILHRWKHDYEQLYNEEICDSFDRRHVDTVKEQVDSQTVPVEHDVDFAVLNAQIARTEVSEAILRAKLGKATGFDNIPAEVLRNGVCSDLLFKIISHCFGKGHIPKDWTKGIINPIPKPRMTPGTHFRGITLLCVPYKVYA
jgi:hypothetical protein